MKSLKYHLRLNKLLTAVRDVDLLLLMFGFKLLHHNITVTSQSSMWISCERGIFGTNNIYLKVRIFLLSYPHD